MNDQETLIAMLEQAGIPYEKYHATGQVLVTKAADAPAVVFEFDTAFRLIDVVPDGLGEAFLG